MVLLTEPLGEEPEMNLNRMWYNTVGYLFEEIE